MSDNFFYSDPPMPVEVIDMQRAVTAGDYPSAFAAADRVLAKGTRHPLAFKLRALSRDEQGRHQEALADFNEALTFDSNDAAAHNAVGLILAKLDRINDAVAAFDRAIAIDPTSPGFLYGKGWAYELAGESDRARETYQSALSVHPGHVESRAGLAWVAAGRGDWTAARSEAEQALAADPGLPKAIISLARADIGEGAHAAAVSRLQSVIEGRRASPQERAVAQTALGDALDGQGDTQQAFDAYTAGNNGLRELNSARFGPGGAETGAQVVDRLLRHFGQATPGTWRAPQSPAPASPAAGHVFLTGFARSGTTLIGQILAGHPRIAELDEQNTLGQPFGHLMNGAEGPLRLLRADRAELDSTRTAYWNRVEALGAAPRDKVVVDKLPMNTLKLPLINRLFPQARILFVRRDPRDVVLSAYRRGFVIGAVNWEFLTLDGAARFYDGVMRLYDLYRDALELNIREQSYEALVEDFEGETRAICEFVGVEWDPALSTFADRVKTRGVGTPSSAQVSQGLYTHGVGQWRAYEAQMAPVLPLLQPWVERFGYPAR